ncbi:OmpA/MotB family protein [Anaerovorax odorimutans]|uniref:OmpA/MotB family protein n=1 Tax=Anaerovorax odorimutans TaxID=109327 RepID=UPI00040D4533|nr:flagellar motor protein MotB [Anaerovorax odorimutans]
MRKQNNKQKSDESSSWLNTYSDMVTLLLCFFVMLFSMSTIDAAKWEMLVKSMNPDADKVSQIIMEEEPPNGENAITSSGSGLLTQNKEFDDIYKQLKKYVEDNDLECDVGLAKGDDFTFIVFRNNILFDGDSYILKQEGIGVLNVLCGGIGEVKEKVGQVRILGHTNQADPNKPNEAEGDRFLASNRATTVLVYIQKKNIIEPKKLVSMEYGQNYPIASFVTPEDRARNRRVEILITKSNAVSITLEEVYKTIGTPILDE